LPVLKGVVMPVGMDFCLLGPLTVRVDGVVVPIPKGMQRALLAALLLRAGRTVTADQLTYLLWGPVLPPSAAITLQNYVKRLRQAFGTGRDRIMTEPGGYLIQVHPGELDISVMEETLTAALRSAHAGAWADASECAAAALGFWQGEALCDVDLGEMTWQEIPRLTEMRLQARELRVEAGLRLGRHAEFVAEAQQLAADVPLREHPQALLMHALYRCGRRAEALETYQHARDVMVDELGIEPGPELQSLHRQILDDDPALTPALPDQPGEPGVPRQLPAAVSHFTGRAAELNALTSMLGEASGTRTVVISALAGTAGVGKTAVAVHWAHQVATHFGDGQLYVNLRGYDPGEPVSAADALAGFLRALGVTGQKIPDGMQERSGLYRTVLAGRQVLVVLDNARDSEQVRPLLPGDPGCAVVITSRDALAGLVAADGARRLDLDALPPAEAAGLLRSLIGRRADQDPDGVEKLAGLCARLPLALRIAAELAAARPEVPLAELVAEFAAARLDLLDAGEVRADVREVFSWSLRQLPGDVVEAFALIGLHPGGDLDAYAVAALTGATAGQARRVLGRLHRASLIQATGPGRYGMHDLLRAYARERAAARDTTGQSQQAALTGMFDYYLAAAAAAEDIVFPAEAHLRPAAPRPCAVIPALRSQAEAREWLDRERANLAATVVHCAGGGWDRHATALASTLFRYLLNGSHLPEASTIFRYALQAARRSGDLAAEAGALYSLGGIDAVRGHLQAAADSYRAALACYRQCGDRAGQAATSLGLGGTEYGLHDFRSAASYCRQAITAYHDVGDRLGAARALCYLSGVETDLGCYDQAAGQLDQALRIFREAGDQLYEAYALERMGALSFCCGQLTEAADFYRQSLVINRCIGNATGAATALTNLGDVSLRQGEYQQAIGHLRQASDQFRRSGNQRGEYASLHSLAEALHKTGQPTAARVELQTALRLAAETGNTYEQGRVHSDLAESHQRTAEGELARHHWQQALDLYTQLRAPEADEVRSRLSAQEGEPDGGQPKA
jgi:DNA-binding SARP family transcriptional activator/tetratricopeptide (TPR) repeat protein